MTKIDIDVVRPDMTAWGNATVAVRLVDAGTGGSVEESVISGTQRIRCDADGHAQVDLTPNGDISPAGSFYAFTVDRAVPATVRCIEVPAANIVAGEEVPYSWADDTIQVLVPAPPVSIPAPALGAEGKVPTVNSTGDGYELQTPGGGSGVQLASTTPAALGTAAVGVGTTAARADHVHQMPTAGQVPVTASEFTGNLSAADTTVQAALATLDALNLVDFGGSVAISPVGDVADVKTPAQAGVSSITVIVESTNPLTIDMPPVSASIGHRFQIALIYVAVPASVTFTLNGAPTSNVGIVGTAFSISPSPKVYLYDCIAGPDLGSGAGWSLTPYGPNDASMVTVAATPTNYTPDDPSTEGHLGGVDDALGRRATIINTDDDPGTTIYVGTVDPTGSYSPVAGDVWLDTSI